MELNFEKVKVLLVDDDENFAFALKALLRAKGLDIESFSNPEEALEFLKNNKYDMILLDYYMPQMTGEQFLTQLRMFDKETIVFLQTAFSEEKPEFEMLKSLNIQGYIDKNKDPNDIFLDIVSGVKMAELLNVIKRQEKEISVLSYKKAIIGELISQLVNESKDQLFQIGTMTCSIENDTDEYNLQLNCIKKATSKINDLYEALNFESEYMMTLQQFKNTVETLLKAKVLISNAHVEYGQLSNGIVLENANEIVYIVVKIIEEMLDHEQKEIKCDFKEEEKNILINISCEKIEFDMNEIMEINTCNNVYITAEGNTISIIIK